jgi:hypothetical protein
MAGGAEVRAFGFGQNARRTCAGCHANMAHLPVFDRRYAVNAAFAAKLPQAGE